VTDINEEFLISVNELKVGDQIGAGGYGVVYRAQWRTTEVAVKMLKHDLATEKLVFLKESALMFKLRHPNIVCIMGIVIDPSICIVTEYCINGDVANLMWNKNYVVEPEHIRKICLDTCRGLVYLHAANIIHRDLKSRNLLIDKDWNIKVADFGLARTLDDDVTMTSCGTPSHVAPEIINHLQYSYKADVYSFGICLYEICVRQKPYGDLPGLHVAAAVAKEGFRPEIPPTLDPMWHNLMCCCWDQVPENRPDFERLVEILSDLDCPPPQKKKPWHVSGEKGHVKQNIDYKKVDTNDPNWRIKQHQINHSDVSFSLNADVQVLYKPL